MTNFTSVKLTLGVIFTMFLTMGNMFADPLMIADFDSKSYVNNLGGEFGAFNYDPNDQNSYCQLNLIDDTDFKKAGAYIEIDYSIKGTKPGAFNGAWFKCNNVDVSAYKAVRLAIKGDKSKGFSTLLKIEVKSPGVTYFFVVNGITDNWQTITIPLSKFEAPSYVKGKLDLENITEAVIVFEDSRMSVKTGVFYMDDFQFITDDTSSTPAKTVAPTKTTTTKKK